CKCLLFVCFSSLLMKLQRGGCPPFWFGFNGRCYKYVSTLMTWADAEQHCVNQGANLVSIHSLAEENFVKLLIRNFDHADGTTWIGLSDLWNTGEPNNSGGSEPCVHTNYGPAKGWNDARCTHKFSSVCKCLFNKPLLICIFNFVI
uniref:C-type lectin domain-containing protein n=1 Tax=Poecilia mexicana TaxID=48701 RepID=A0A3B3Y9F3_9TELE